MPAIQDVYPSRVSEKPAILDRQDPVVYSQKPPTRGLTTEQARSYEQNGFLAVPNFFSLDEVGAFKKELRRLANSEDIKNARESITEKNSGAVRSVFRVHAISEFFSRLCRDERLLDIVQYLLNDNVYIHQSRINYKPGFEGQGFYWHSDFETWHVEDGMPRMRCISCSISLTENNEFNGPLMLIPGSQNYFVSCIGKTPEGHYRDSLKEQEIGVPDKESMEVLTSKGGLEQATAPAGSVLFFECNAMHGSASNISPFPRSNVFFVYNAMSNAVVEPFCGLRPRPEFIATRENIEPLKAINKHWLG